MKKGKEKKSAMPYTKICKPFKEARSFVQTLGIKNVEQWLDYCKSGKKPNDIPHKPERIYKNNGWKSYGDWFGVWKEERVRCVKKKEARSCGKYMPFKEARQFVRFLKIRNVKEWFGYCDSGKRPKNIPYNPDRAYKNSGWKSYADWLGTATASSSGAQYGKFEEIRVSVGKPCFNENAERREYGRSAKKTTIFLSLRAADL